MNDTSLWQRNQWEPHTRAIVVRGVDPLAATPAQCAEILARWERDAAELRRPEQAA